jgi:hypothetical protein
MPKGIYPRKNGNGKKKDVVPVKNHKRSAPHRRITIRAVQVKTDAYGREWFSFLDNGE